MHVSSVSYARKQYATNQLSDLAIAIYTMGILISMYS